MSGLTFTRFRVGYKVLERAAFPADKGPAFRVGLLADLRDTACGQAPGLCPLAAGGVLPFVYTPPSDARTWLLAGDALMASLILVGKTADHGACYIHALDRKVRRGLGAGRCLVILEQVDYLDPRDRKWTSYYFSKEQEIRSRPVAFDWHQIEERARLLRGRSRITLGFTTPLRLPRGPILARELLGALHARLRAVGSRWGWAAVPSGSEDVRVLEEGLEWRERPRRVPEARGHVTLEGDLDGWFPLLVAGQHLHVGLGAAMGFGGYELRP